MKSRRHSSKIFLMGMPSAGKTTIGKCLAQDLGYSFFDLDQAIARAEGLSITEIFAQYGEAYFRELEKNTLQELGSHSAVVIATGGGAPCFHDNLAFMNTEGITVFLQVPHDVLVERLSKRTGRPMFDDISEVKLKVQSLWNARRSYYLQADLVLEESSYEAIKKRIEQFVQSAQ